MDKDNQPLTLYVREGDTYVPYTSPDVAPRLAEVDAARSMFEGAVRLFAEAQIATRASITDMHTTYKAMAEDARTHYQHLVSDNRDHFEASSGRVLNIVSMLAANVEQVTAALLEATSMPSNGRSRLAEALPALSSLAKLALGNGRMELDEERRVVLGVLRRHEAIDSTQLQRLEAIETHEEWDKAIADLLDELLKTNMPRLQAMLTSLTPEEQIVFGVIEARLKGKTSE